MDRLGSVGFYSPSLRQFCIASRLVCSFCETMAGSLSVASTAVLSAEVTVVESAEVGSSTVYIRYNNGPRTLPLGTTAMVEESSIHSVSSFTRKCIL
jgi:hypothetical protein